MNGYEIMRRNVEFESPPRVGLRFTTLNVSDVQRIYLQLPRSLADNQQASMTKKPRPLPGNADEWGCIWDSGVQGDMGLVIKHPLSDWAQFDDLVFPDPYADGRFDGLEEALVEAEGKYVQLNSPFCLFERMHFLRGFEDLLTDLYLEPEKLEALADRVIEYQIGIAKRAAELGRGRIHCFDTTDDWGTQHGLIIRPDMWRKIFKPRYKRLFDVVHDAGMHVRFHTDGKILEIFDDFVELGVDIFNIHQPRLVGIEELSRYTGKICFEVAVDVQSTLPTGDRDLIFAEVKEIVDKLSTPHGGLIGVEYRFLEAIGATRQSLQWALEAYKKYGNISSS